jgi:hypothetical protein
MMATTKLVRTFGDLHFCDCLPLVHGNKPRPFFPSTAEINHKLVPIAAKRCKDLFQTWTREST